MQTVHAVLALALLEYLGFGMAVGWARGRYGVAAPATTGHPLFERYYRVQMNTLELLVVFVPALLLFAHYVSVRGAAGLGLLWIVGRLVYFATYVRDPAKRSLGFGLSFLPLLALLFGGLCAATLAAIRG